MSGSAADVAATIEYSSDKWFMDRIPWALWVSAAGLVVILHTDDSTGSAAVLAVVYLGLVGLAFAGWALTTMIAKSGVSFLADFSVSLLVFIAVGGIIGIVAGSVGSSVGLSGMMRWSQLVKPPEAVFGWMMIYLGMGWTLYALWRHVRPARPVLAVTPDGLAFHRSWLRDLHIPWQDVRRVGPVELEAFPWTNPKIVVVAIGQDFYDRHIAPRRRFLEPPGTDFMFRPKGEMMQMVLSADDVRVDPEHLQAPIEARWQAFRDRPRSPSESGDTSAPRTVLGRWSMDGSWWQAVQFLAPVLGMVAIVLHARIVG